MSDNTVYANVKPRDTSEKTTKDLAMETEEVTYSDITILKTAKNNKKDSDADEDGVIYAKVTVSQKANDLDPSAPAKPDPADSSLKPDPQKEGHGFKSLKCTTIVQLFVCVLLLAVAVTMLGLYIVKEENYSDMEENLRNLEAQYKNISDEKMAVEIRLAGVQEYFEILRVKHANVTSGLEANISEITQALEMLREQYDNATANASVMILALEANLSEQIERNDNLTKEITKLKHGYQGVRRCADNWQSHEGSLYYFSTDIKSWTESRDACEAMGGHLAIITSETEQNFLKTKVGDFWIGLTQAQPEGDWYWVDNTKLTNPKLWNSNQPDNHTGDDPVNGEDCVNIDKGMLNDNTCSRKLKRICESKSCRD